MDFFETWIAHFTYPDESGAARSKFVEVQASDKEMAKSIALRQAPSEEFLLQIHAVSDDQFLGHVRRDASRMNGSATGDATRYDLDDAEDAPVDLEAVLAELLKLKP